MKTSIKNLIFLPVVIAGLGLMLAAARVTAQTFSTLHSFTSVFLIGPPADFQSTNNDGAWPVGGLLLASNALYGTAGGAGDWGYGTVFAIKPDGTGFTNLHNFTGNDGVYPQGTFILSSGSLYGTASTGGAANAGTVFSVNSDGTAFTTLHAFTGVSWVSTNSDGSVPLAGLILSGGTLYGTTVYGGSSGSGTIFKVKSDGTGFTNLHNFTALLPYHTNGFGGVISSNSDGAFPAGGVILSGNTLYGTAQNGGGSGRGTVFAINTDGSGFTNLYNFAAGHAFFSNSDGAGPVGSLTLLGKTLYGMAGWGGSWGNGTVFAVNTDGTSFTNLHSFTVAFGPASTNTDGAEPTAGMVLSGNTLFGTAYGGGKSGNGTVFKINPDGTGFATLHNFTATSTNPPFSNVDGSGPLGGLILSGNTLYGTTVYGGSSGSGTVFSLSIPPELSIKTAGLNLVFGWPTNFTGYTLQSTTNLVSPAWTTNFPAAVIVNGQNTVTNPISGTQRFFRLSQ